MDGWMNGWAANGKCGQWAMGDGRWVDVACACWIISPDRACPVYRVCVFVCVCVCVRTGYADFHFIALCIWLTIWRRHLSPNWACCQLLAAIFGVKAKRNGREKPVCRGENAQRTIKCTNQLRGLNCGQLIWQFACHGIGLVRNLFGKHLLTSSEWKIANGS